MTNSKIKPNSNLLQNQNNSSMLYLQWREVDVRGVALGHLVQHDAHRPDVHIRRVAATIDNFLIVRTNRNNQDVWKKNHLLERNLTR